MGRVENRQGSDVASLDTNPYECEDVNAAHAARGGVKALLPALPVQNLKVEKGAFKPKPVVLQVVVEGRPRNYGCEYFRVFQEPLSLMQRTPSARPAVLIKHPWTANPRKIARRAF